MITIHQFSFTIDAFLSSPQPGQRRWWNWGAHRWRTWWNSAGSPWYKYVYFDINMYLFWYKYVNFLCQYISPLIQYCITYLPTKTRTKTEPGVDVEVPGDEVAPHLLHRVLLLLGVHQVNVRRKPETGFSKNIFPRFYPGIRLSDIVWTKQSGIRFATWNNRFWK